jgi:hypothetical protein
MGDTVDVTIPVDEVAARALSDPATRERVGRRVSQMLREEGIERLSALIEAMRAEAVERGITDEIFDAEMAAWNAEGRGDERKAG